MAEHWLHRNALPVRRRRNIHNRAKVHLAEHKLQLLLLCDFFHPAHIALFHTQQLLP